MFELRQKLEAKKVRLEDFQAINALLISKGFLSRRDGVRHSILYDVAKRCEDELQEAFGVLYGAELVHDSRTLHYRLLPFGDRGDGLPDPGDDMEIRRELSSGVAKDFVVALLTLKILFNEQIADRRIEADGRVSIRATEFATAMKIHFKSDLPAADTHRKAIFRKLKKLGAAEFDIDSLKDLKNEESVISIRPEIETLVPDSAIGKAIHMISQSAAPAAAEQPDEDDAPSMSANEMETAQ